MTATIPDSHPHRHLEALRPSDDEALTVPRRVSPEDWARFERYAGEILGAFGMDLTSPGTAATPRRFIRALFDATDGYDGDPKLLTAFPTECRGGSDCELAQVVEGPIPFFALCEHHVLPFFGKAWIGYVAHDQIIGVSKLTRLVRVMTRRFGVQERMTHGIADTLGSMLDPHLGGPVLYWFQLVLLARRARRGETARAAQPSHGAVRPDRSVLHREIGAGLHGLPDRLEHGRSIVGMNALDERLEGPAKRAGLQAVMGFEGLGPLEHPGGVVHVPDPDVAPSAQTASALRRSAAPRRSGGARCRAQCDRPQTPAPR